MKILNRYISRGLLSTFVLALSVLVGLFSFFTLADELGDTGRGDYGTWEAIQYVALSTPSLIAELLPIAAVIASMAALGVFASNRELVAMRVAGVSQWRLALSLCRSGIPMIILSLLLTEFIAPVGEQTAHNLRSVAISKQITMRSKFGFWSRDGNNYINIRRLLPDNKLEDIYVYEFNNKNELLASYHAQNAEYIEDTWVLYDVKKTIVDKNYVDAKRISTLVWDAKFNPEVINLVTIKPEHLSMYGLYRYIGFLNENDQNADVYWQAFWKKLIKPFSILLMLILAIPLINAHSENKNTGQRVFIGALIGISFHLVSQVFLHIGIVFNFAPIVSVTLPTLVVLAFVLYIIFIHETNRKFFWFFNGIVN